MSHKTRFSISDSPELDAWVKTGQAPKGALNHGSRGPEVQASNQTPFHRCGVQAKPTSNPPATDNAEIRDDAYVANIAFKELKALMSKSVPSPGDDHSKTSWRRFLQNLSVSGRKAREQLQDESPELWEKLKTQLLQP